MKCTHTYTKPFTDWCVPIDRWFICTRLKKKNSDGQPRPVKICANTLVDWIYRFFFFLNLEEVGWSTSTFNVSTEQDWTEFTPYSHTLPLVAIFYILTIIVAIIIIKISLRRLNRNISERQHSHSKRLRPSGTAPELLNEEKKKTWAGLSRPCHTHHVVLYLPSSAPHTLNTHTAG